MYYKMVFKGNNNNNNSREQSTTYMHLQKLLHIKSAFLTDDADIAVYILTLLHIALTILCTFLQHCYMVTHQKSADKRAQTEERRQKSTYIRAQKYKCNYKENIYRLNFHSFCYISFYFIF